MDTHTTRSGRQTRCLRRSSSEQSFFFHKTSRPRTCLRRSTSLPGHTFSTCLPPTRADRSSSCSAVIAFLMYSMFTYGMFRSAAACPTFHAPWQQSILTPPARVHPTPLPSTSLISPFLGREGSIRIRRNIVHTSTDLRRTACPSLLLVRLQGLCGPICFGFLSFEKAQFTHILGVLLFLFLELLLRRAASTCTCVLAHCNHDNERATPSARRRHQGAIPPHLQH